jgi:hypothetical protein
LLLAEALRLPRPYWVPVSCLAVLQGVTLRAVWNRQFQRVAGTALGCVVGLLGGMCLHSPRLREALARGLRALLPRRFRRRPE